MNIRHLMRDALRAWKSMGTRRSARIRNGVRVFPAKRGSILPSFGAGKQAARYRVIVLYLLDVNVLFARFDPAQFRVFQVVGLAAESASSVEGC